MIDPFLIWLESTAFSAWIRESPSVFSFPAILSLHTIGMGLVAGINAALDLCLLGCAPRVQVSELRRFLPAVWFGFWLNAASGVVLLIGYPTKAVTNPVFYVKLMCIALAILLLRRVTPRLSDGSVVEGERIPGRLRLLAVASLVCWTAAITAGRLLAYTYSRLMATGF